MTTNSAAVLVAAHQAGTAVQNCNLDLSQAAVQLHWSKKGVADAVAAMEMTETWALESTEEVGALLASLAAKLSAASPETISEIMCVAREDAVDFMGYLKSGRALYFFYWLSEVNPELVTVLLDEARSAGSDFGVLLLERLRVLERQNLLAKIFAPERIHLVLTILAEADMDQSNANSD